MPYPNKQAVVDALMGKGWTLVGEAPSTMPNPRAGEYGQPPTVPDPSSTVLSVTGPAGTTPDRITIKQVGNGPWKGGVGYDVVEGPKNPIPKDTTPTPIANWERVDEDGKPVAAGAAASFLWDPKTGNVLKLEEGAKKGNPDQWQEKVVAGATVVYDPVSGSIVATVPASASDANKRTGVYDDMPDPNDPTGKRIIGKVDTGSKEIFAVAREPKTQKQILETPNKVFVFNDDGSIANTIDITPDKAPVLVPMGNTVYVFNPADKTFTKGPEVDEPATVGLSTQNEWYIFFDKNGKEVNRVKNPSWTGHPQPAAPPTSLSAPVIPRWNPQKGVWEDVPNTGRLTIGEVTQQMIKDLTGQTVDPAHPMTLDEANSVLTSAISKMNADAQKAATAAGAAQNILSGQQQGAQTGAGILNQRSQTAQNLVQQGLNVATSTGGRYGNYSGGMLSPVPGLGQALTQGAQAYATELGGGQAVFDTAVRMVQAADPNNSNPDRAAAVATLTQVMDKYRRATGQDYPTVAATKAAASSSANNGLVAPPTVPAPLAGLPAPGQAPNLFHATPPIIDAQGQPAWSYPIAPVAATQPRSAAQLGFTAPDMFAQAGIGGMGYR